jgi:hypothetical protein
MRNRSHARRTRAGGPAMLAALALVAALVAGCDASPSAAVLQVCNGDSAASASVGVELVAAQEHVSLPPGACASVYGIPEGSDASMTYTVTPVDPEAYQAALTDLEARLDAAVRAGTGGDAPPATAFGQILDLPADLAVAQQAAAAPACSEAILEGETVTVTLSHDAAGGGWTCAETDRQGP